MLAGSAVGGPLTWLWDQRVLCCGLLCYWTGRVLGAVTETPHVYAEILPDLLPALDVLVTPDGIDHLEDALEILSYLTFYPKPPFPPKLWTYFDALFQAVCGGSTPSRPLPESLASGWAADHLEQMLPLLSNFIGRDPESFAAGRTETGIPYPECIVRMAQLCVQDNDEARNSKHASFQFDSFISKDQ